MKGYELKALVFNSHHSNIMHEATRKRTRTVMTPEQSKVLYAVLRETYFPSTQMREVLAKKLNMKPRTVQIWFQNQRQKKKTQKSYKNFGERAIYSDGMLTPPLMPLDMLACAALNLEKSFAIQKQFELVSSGQEDKENFDNSLQDIEFDSSDSEDYP